MQLHQDLEDNKGDAEILFAYFTPVDSIIVWDDISQMTLFLSNELLRLHMYKLNLFVNMITPAVTMQQPVLPFEC